MHDGCKYVQYVSKAGAVAWKNGKYPGSIFSESLGCLSAQDQAFLVAHLAYHMSKVAPSIQSWMCCEKVLL